MRFGSIVLSGLIFGCSTVPSTRAVKLTHQALVADGHSDITEQIVYDHYDFARRHTAAQSMEDLPRLREGGLDAQIFAIWVNHDRVPPERFFSEAEHELLTAREALGKIPGIALATTAAQIRENKAHGVVSAIFGVEGGYMLSPGDELEHLRRFAVLGARYLTLTHTKRGSIGGSSGDASDGEGLTGQGRLILEEMGKLGVVVDVSHVSDPLFWDVNFYAGFLDAGAFAAIDAAEDRLKARGIEVAKLGIAEERRAVSQELRGLAMPTVGTVADHIQTSARFLARTCCAYWRPTKSGERRRTLSLASASRLRARRG
jgi:hypothetical protein